MDTEEKDNSLAPKETRHLDHTDASSPRAKDFEAPSGPLGEMIASIVMEFEAGEKVKTPEDYPDHIAYLRGVENNLLVNVRKRLPQVDRYGRQSDTHKTGYFVEVAQLNGGIPEFGLSDISLLGQGNYERVEVTDEPQDPLASKGFTPTQFPYTFRRRMREQMRSAPKALPTNEEESTGLLSGLFANIRMRNVQEETRGQDTASAKKEITQQFFYPNSDQGFSKEVQNAAVIVTAEPEDSSLFRVAKEVGLKTYRITPEEIIASLKDLSTTFFKSFQEQHGMYPLVIVLDNSSLTASPQTNEAVGATQYSVSRFAKEYPLFSFVDRIAGTRHVARLGYGWYNEFGQDIDAMKRLFLKIGADFALTTETRRIASALS